MFLIAFTGVKAQYLGGTDDGFGTSQAQNQNALQNIYGGGADDGFNQAVTATTQNPLANLYTGGTDDGFAAVTALLQNSLPNIYAGGTDDGFNHSLALSQNTTPDIYKGGADDGFARTLVLSQNPTDNIYQGGNDDGFAAADAAPLQNPLGDIYKGGTDDGFAALLVLNQNPLNPLSLDILDLSGRWQNQDAVLDWTTENEKEVERYEIERSIEGVDFVSLGYVKAKGSGGVQSRYSFIDFNAGSTAADVYLYRLKAVSANGSAVYSAVVRLTKAADDPVIIVYPNPTTGHFSLRSGNGALLDGYQYSITSSNGSIVERGRLAGILVQFDLSSRAAGTYILSIHHDTQQARHFSIILTK